MWFDVRYYYDTEKGLAHKMFRLYFENTMTAQYQVANYALKDLPSCRKITIEWESGTQRKMRTLRKNEYGFFRRTRN